MNTRRDFAKKLIGAGTAVLPIAGLGAQSLQLGAKEADTVANAAAPIQCAGTYPGHLQGVCIGDQGNIYWSFTTVLVKTDEKGAVLQKVSVARHHGDLCYVDGKVYVAVNLGPFNDAAGRADSWIYVYKASDLSFVKKHRAVEPIYGAGGITFHNRTFFVVGGLPKGFEENYIYEYADDFRFLRRITLKSGYTQKGIQTACYSRGHWWFGCYGSPPVLLKVAERFNTIQKFVFDCSTGIVSARGDSFWVGRVGRSADGGHTGQLLLASADAAQGLVIRPL
jgi:hypothetical protein